MPCFFFVRLWARCSRTFVRSAPCPRLPRLVRLAPRLVNVWQEITTPLRMLAFRDFRRLLCVCLSLVVVRLWRGAHVLRVRSAPRPRLSRLLPFALWQDTSLQAKKQCSRRTTKHNFGCAFFFVRLWARCSRTSCTLRSSSSSFLTCAPCFVFGQRLTRDTVPPFAIFNACSAPDYLFVSNTLRASFSSFSALAVCSLASHLFASKKAVFKTYNKSTAICRAF